MADERLLPGGIKDDNTEALNELIQKLHELDLTKLLIYMIDTVDESALLYLAQQFHVMGSEGWNLAQSKTEKRNLIKSAIEAHRYKGTKFSLKKVLESFNFIINIEEWFSYGGTPFHFKIFIDLLDRGIDEKTYSNIEALINEYKNARSHLESIELNLTNIGQNPAFASSLISSEEIFINAAEEE